MMSTKNTRNCGGFHSPDFSWVRVGEISQKLAIILMNFSLNFLLENLYHGARSPFFSGGNLP